MQFEPSEVILKQMLIEINVLIKLYNKCFYTTIKVEHLYKNGENEMLY